MKKQRTIAALMSAALLLTAGAYIADAVQARAADTLTSTTTEADSTAQQVAVTQETTAVITEILKQDDTVHAIVAQPSQENSQPLQFNVDANTLYLDSETGQAFTAGALKVGDKITVSHGLAMTRSIPAQVYAEAVVRIPQEKENSPVHLLVAEQVTKEEDGSVSILTQQGGLIVRVQKDTPIAPYQTKNIVTSADIVEGTRFAAWYEIVAMSYPGQATAARVVILPEQAESAPSTETLTPKEDEVEVLPNKEPSVMKDGQVIAAVQKIGDTLMVPLRTVAEAADFQVTWEKETQTAHLQKDTMEVTVQLGQTQAWKNIAGQGRQDITFAQAPTMQEPGAIWVPAQLFLDLLGEENFVLTGDSLELK